MYSMGEDCAVRPSASENVYEKYLLLPEGYDTESITTSGKVNIISEKSDVTPDAVDQLEATSKLPNIVLAVGLPDLHVGKFCPIGASCASKGVFYPHLVGMDI